MPLAADTEHPVEVLYEDDDLIAGQHTRRCLVFCPKQMTCSSLLSCGRFRLLPRDPAPAALGGRTSGPAK